MLQNIKDERIWVWWAIENFNYITGIKFAHRHTKRGYVIDVCVPNDYGMARQEREKIVKYQDLKNDIADTHGLQPVDVIPVVIGATGLMKQNLQKYLQLLPAKITSLELQIETIRETVSLLKRALGCRLAT